MYTALMREALRQRAVGHIEYDLAKTKYERQLRNVLLRGYVAPDDATPCLYGVFVGSRVAALAATPREIKRRECARQVVLNNQPAVIQVRACVAYWVDGVSSSYDEPAAVVPTAELVQNAAAVVRAACKLSPRTSRSA